MVRAYSSKYRVPSQELQADTSTQSAWSWPDITGLHEFQGHLCPSADFKSGYDLSGKRVAVVGNGSSGIQIVPEIQRVASKVVNFARSKTVRLPAPEENKDCLLMPKVDIGAVRGRSVESPWLQSVMYVSSSLCQEHRADGLDTQEAKERFRTHPEELKSYRKRLAHAFNHFYDAVRPITPVES